MLNASIYLLLGILVITSVLMVLIVLMQRPKNEGLGASFGGGMTQDLFGAQTTNVLQKFTVYLGAVFFLSSLLLTVLYSRMSTQSSGVQKTLQASAAVAAAKAKAQPSPSAAPAIETAPAALPASSATPAASTPEPAATADATLPSPSTTPAPEATPAAEPQPSATAPEQPAAPASSAILPDVIVPTPAPAAAATP